ncbi:hypothetical protein [Cypionkella sp.]|uniref:hypothetical protein n=1 Tax=Cypionkella sp. TaxID=2811411 RepID=UPI002716873C|nr:hypothetical protein [Cypionkella sp.]MDO8983015.1 hypothetical protein [Cypionkella sp.]
MADIRWTDIFFGKLQVLLGERSPKSGAAVRFSDLAGVYDASATTAKMVFVEASAGIVTDLTAVEAAVVANVIATDAAQAELNDLTNGLVMGLDGALASMEATQTTLAKSIDSVAESVQGYQIILDALADGSVGSAVTVALNGAAIGQADTLKITEGATARVTSAPPNGFTINIPQSRALLLAGQRVKIGVLAKQPTTGFATKFGIIYTSADGTSTYLPASANLTASWKWFTFFYDMPAAVAGGAGYLSIFGDDSKTGKSTVVARAYLEVAAVAGELPEITTLQGSITDIEALDISALEGTAFATFLTQLGVVAGGASAFVTATGSAVAKLADDAAAMYSLRVGAGGASAGMEIVAADNPVTGPASSIKLSAKHIDILASSVRISDSGNIFPDFDMLDPLFYSSSDSAEFSFIGTTTASLGRQFLNIAANAAAKSVDTGWFGVEPNTEYLVSGAAFLSSTAAGQGTATLTIETGLVDGAGAVSVVTSTVVQARTDLNYAGILTAISLLTGATVRRARFKLTRAAGGAGLARAGGFKVQKKSGASLIVNGSITATKLIQTEAVITNTAQIADLTVARIHIGVGAVTEFSEVETTITHNGLSTYGSAVVIAVEQFTIGADVPEKLILTAYVDGISSTANNMDTGQIRFLYAQIVDRLRGGVYTTLRSGSKVVWEYSTDGTRMVRVFTANPFFEQYSVLYKDIDYIAGDVIRINYFYERFRVSGTTIDGSMAASNVGYTLEEFYK